MLMVYQKNIDELKLLVDEEDLNILAINETKLDNETSNEIISLDNFDLRRKDRNRHGGGVAIYIRDDIKYLQRCDLPNHTLELICIEIRPSHSEPFNIVAWYRPPSDPIDTLNQLENILGFLDKEGKDTILLGDTNCNFLSNQGQTENLSYPNNTVKQLDSIYKLFVFTQIINDATRVTLSTSTLIDHIATNNNSNISRSEVLKTTFSDHYMAYCARKLRGAFKKEHKYIMSRKISKLNRTDFVSDVINVPWETIVRSYETVKEVVFNFT